MVIVARVDFGDDATVMSSCIASRYALCMTQFVTRISVTLAADIDQLVAEGVVESRSDAVRVGLRRLVAEHRRQRTADAIVEGYRVRPQRDGEVGWPDAATVGMIGDEPW